MDEDTTYEGNDGNDGAASRALSSAGTSQASTTDTPATIRHAIALIAKGELEAAVKLLLEDTAHDSLALKRGLLGTAYTLLERYDDAKRELAAALELDPTNQEWADKLLLASSDAAARVNIDFPPVVPFDREELLAPPVLASGALPTPPSTRRARPLRPLLSTLGNLTGALIGNGWRVLSPLAARLGPQDPVWTTWYRKPIVFGLMTLGYARDQLDRNNLKDTYPEGELTAFQSRGLVPPPGVERFRTADGSWNNLSNPKEGAAGVRFPRNVALTMTRPARGAALYEPNPAEISHVLLTREQGIMKAVPFLNLLAASWIQFMVHGWVSHRAHPIFGVHEIPLPADHPARRLYHQTAMFIGKTSDDPTRGRKDEGSPPTAINEVSSWWDGSQIYGNDQKTADSLRSFRDGKLKIDADGRLPLGEGGIERTGYNRNWWVGLSMMHALFTLEHNAICDALKKHYPDWSDHVLYNVARLINAAVMAKIHTTEWTPAILPNPALQAALLGNWYGLAEVLFRKRGDRRTLRPFKIQNPEVGGLVGNRIDKHGAPYGLSEEFTEVYRMHDLLPDQIAIQQLATNRPLAAVPLAGARQEAAYKLTAKYSMADLFFSFGNQHPGQLVLNNYPKTLQQLSIPGNPIYDLGAVDILRARERGIPRYNDFRRQLGLNPIRRFEDLTTNAKDLEALKRVYKNDVELIDMQVGSRAESTRPTGFGFGETLFQVFILNASRRLQGDRFYTESYNEETYTKEGLDWIDATDFKSVLLRHYPDLARSGLSNVDNAFEPWDTGELDLVRHPLRAFS
jgi:hypothetical protein